MSHELGRCEAPGLRSAEQARAARKVVVTQMYPAAPTDRERARWAEFERESVALFEAIRAEDPAQIDYVMEGLAGCETDPEFLGFVSTYKRLAELIPLHWGVLDFGCAYAPQAWYFQHHAFYVGVDHARACELGEPRRFSFAGTQHVQASIDQYLDALPTFEVPVFAIANYVPASKATLRRLRDTFEDVFVFYPKSRG